MDKKIDFNILNEDYYIKPNVFINKKLNENDEKNKKKIYPILSDLNIEQKSSECDGENGGGEVCNIENITENNFYNNENIYCSIENIYASIENIAKNNTVEIEKNIIEKNDNNSIINTFNSMNNTFTKYINNDTDNSFNNSINNEENMKDERDNNIENYNRFIEKYDKRINELSNKENREKIGNFNLSSDFVKDVLLNFNHERFDINNIDNWMFNEANTNWPSYVKYIYYTKNTMDNTMVQLSYKVNLFLNKCFSAQNQVFLYRLGDYHLYHLMMKLQRNINFKDIKNEYINAEKINGYSHIELFYNDQNLIKHDHVYYTTKLVKTSITEPLLSNYCYKDYYDYLPICGIGPKYFKLRQSCVQYPDADSIYTSSICFHKYNCHDNWCTTHNNNLFSIYKHKHYDLQPYHIFDDNQTIKIG